MIADARIVITRTFMGSLQRAFQNYPFRVLIISFGILRLSLLALRYILEVLLSYGRDFSYFDYIIITELLSLLYFGSLTNLL